MYAKFKTIEDFNIWHSKVNEVKGYGEGKPTTQYTSATVNPDKTEVYAVVDSECPADLMPETISKEEFAALNFLPIQEEI